MLTMALAVTTGCDRPHHDYHKQTKQQVHVYKQHGTNYVNLQAARAVGKINTDDNDWIYWYVIYYHNTMIYASSTSYIAPSSYNSLNWAETTAPSVVSASAAPIEPVETTTVENTSLGEATDAVIEAGETQAQMDAMVNEGNPNTGETTSESGTETGGESGGDMGGGGGDSGGGGGVGD